MKPKIPKSIMAKNRRPTRDHAFDQTASGAQLVLGDARDAEVRQSRAAGKGQAFARNLKEALGFSDSKPSNIGGNFSGVSGGSVSSPPATMSDPLFAVAAEVGPRLQATAEALKERNATAKIQLSIIADEKHMRMTITAAGKGARFEEYGARAHTVAARHAANLVVSGRPLPKGRVIHHPGIKADHAFKESIAATHALFVQAISDGAARKAKAELKFPKW